MRVLFAQKGKINKQEEYDGNPNIHTKKEKHWNPNFGCIFSTKDTMYMEPRTLLLLLLLTFK